MSMCALPIRTCLLAPPFSSILLPSTMKGKLSGSAGFACGTEGEDNKSRIVGGIECHQA